MVPNIVPGMVEEILTCPDNGVAEFMIYTEGQMDLEALIQHYTPGQTRLLAAVEFPYRGEIAASYNFLLKW